MENEIFDVDRITHNKSPEAWLHTLESEDAHIRAHKGFTVKEARSYKNNGSTNGLLPSHPIHLN